MLFGLLLYLTIMTHKLYIYLKSTIKTNIDTIIIIVYPSVTIETLNIMDEPPLVNEENEAKLNPTLISPLICAQHNNT